LFAAGISGVLIILFNVVKGYRQRRQVHLTMEKVRALPEVA
jgi:hypothetical protein